LVLVVAAVAAWATLGRSHPHAGPPVALTFLPPPRPAAGYLSLTATALNRLQPDRAEEGRAVRFVGAVHPSTGPDVVSVHPISDSVWAAVARAGNGTCYAELVVTRGVAGATTRWATFPKATACSGTLATPATVTSTLYPR
jgi:hypothetical protein